MRVSWSLFHVFTIMTFTKTRAGCISMISWYHHHDVKETPAMTDYLIEISVPSRLNVMYFRIYVLWLPSVLRCKICNIKAPSGELRGYEEARILKMSKRYDQIIPICKPISKDHRLQWIFWGCWPRTQITRRSNAAPVSNFESVQPGVLWSLQLEDILLPFEIFHIGCTGRSSPGISWTGLRHELLQSRGCTDHFRSPKASSNVDVEVETPRAVY